MQTPARVISGARRWAWLVLALALVPISAGCGTAVGASPASPTASAVQVAPPASSGSAPGQSGGGGTGIASTGVAVAYPYPGYPGTPGLAPDNTIVVTGFGHAPMAADQSDRPNAQLVALKAALADARSQADVVARSTGVKIKGVLSVSVSSAQGFCCPVPMPLGGEMPNSPSAVPGGPTVVGPPIAPTPEFAVTVTVAYRIG